MSHVTTLGQRVYRFDDLRTLLAKASPARSGDALAGHRGGQRGRTRGRAHGAGRPAAARVSRRGGGAVRKRRGHAADHRQPSAEAFAPVAHLTVGEFREWLLAEPAGSATLAAIAPGPHAGDGRRRHQADAQPGPDRGGEEAPGGHRLPQHPRPARPAGGAPAAEPPDRRRAGHRRLDARRPDVRLRRRGDRHQPGHRQPGHARSPAAPDGRLSPALRGADAVVRADPRHQHDPGDRAGRAGRPGVPVDRRHRAGQRQLRRRPGAAARGARGRAVAAARHGGRAT